MKKFLSGLMLGLLMGAVSYPILFNEAKAESPFGWESPYTCLDGSDAMMCKYDPHGSCKTVNCPGSNPPEQ